MANLGPGQPIINSLRGLRVPSNSQSVGGALPAQTSLPAAPPPPPAPLAPVATPRHRMGLCQPQHLVARGSSCLSHSERLSRLRLTPLVPLLLPNAGVNRYRLLESTHASRPSTLIVSHNSRRQSNGTQMTKGAGATWTRAGRACSQLRAQSVTQRRSNTGPNLRKRKRASS